MPITILLILIKMKRNTKKMMLLLMKDKTKKQRMTRRTTKIKMKNGYLMNGYCAFQKCKLFKTNTIKINNNSSSLSDLRLLSLNDMYLFEQEMELSITRYFDTSVHKRIIVFMNYRLYRARPLPISRDSSNFARLSTWFTHFL